MSGSSIYFPVGLEAKKQEYLLEQKLKFYGDEKEINLLDKIADEIPDKDIVGELYRTTSVIGMDELEDLEENGDAKERSITEGYSIQIKKRRKANIIPITAETARDWWRSKNWLKEFIEANYPVCIRTVLADFIRLIDRGGLTAGHELFNNSTKNSTDSSGDLGYDGKPMIALSGNNHVAKDGNTYYNGVATELTGADGLTNFLDAHILLTSTNAKTEAGVPFELQGKKLFFLGNTQQAAYADMITNSQLNASTSTNAKTPKTFQSRYEILETTRFTNSNQWAIGVCKFGLVYKIFEPIIDYWTAPKSQKQYALIAQDYMIGCKNFRTIVGSNFSTS